MDNVMRKKFKKKAKKRKTKKYSKKKINGVDKNLQKVVDFKFQTLGKIYKNFTEKRKSYQKKERIRKKK